MKNKKTIGIDARLYGPIGKGLGRYTKEIVDGLLRLDTDNNYVIFLCEENYPDFDDSAANVKKVLVKARWYSIAEQIVMPYHIWREKINLMHFPHFNVPLLSPCKFIVTVHDLILTKFPTQRATTLSPFLYKIKHYMYQLVIKAAIFRSKKVITVSNFTKDDIIDYFGVSEDKIVVTYEGVSKDFDTQKTCDNNLVLRYNISEPFLLYVGNAYPHKNLEGLIGTYSEIRKRLEISLVLVGKDDYFYKKVKEYTDTFPSEVKENIVFPGFVPDSDLSCLYKRASAYIFPSFFEGFGLPPLEAMSQGCAVVSSNKTCLPEILGEAACYFDPDNREDMQKKIEKVISDEQYRGQLIERGYKQVEFYNWDECVADTLKIILEN